MMFTLNAILLVGIVLTVKATNDHHYCGHRWISESFYASSHSTTSILSSDTKTKGYSRSDVIVKVGDAIKFVRGYRTGTFEKSSVTISTAGFCTEAGDVLYSADFNGDLQEDILCYRSNNAGGTFQIRYKTPFAFSATQTYGGLFTCPAGNTLLIGDFDGNKAADIACLDANVVSSRVYLGQSCKKTFSPHPKQYFKLPHKPPYPMYNHPKAHPAYPAMPAPHPAMRYPAPHPAAYPAPHPAMAYPAPHPAAAYPAPRPAMPAYPASHPAMPAYPSGTHYRYGRQAMSNPSQYVYNPYGSYHTHCPPNLPAIISLPSGTFPGCRPGVDKMIAADSNGDHKDDIVCHKDNNQISFFTSTGNTASVLFSGNVDASNTVTCNFADSKLKAADVDGDGDMDLLCIGTATQFGISYYSSGTYHDFTSDSSCPIPCNYPNADAIFAVGDFNEDGKDDVMCKYSKNGGSNTSITEIIFSEKKM